MRFADFKKKSYHPNVDQPSIYRIENMALPKFKSKILNPTIYKKQFCMVNLDFTVFKTKIIMYESKKNAGTVSRKLKRLVKMSCSAYSTE